MRIEKETIVDGKTYIVILSDESQALLAADAAGRAVVGLWDPGKPDVSLSPALYVVTDPADADQEFLERVVRRKLKLPWIICGTRRLTVRELTAADAAAVVRDPEDTAMDAVFYEEETLQSYVENQYRFYEWGLWGVTERESGRLVGVAGFTAVSRPEEGPGSARKELLGASQALTLELGYHIFSPYRRRGYGFEACRGILDRVAREGGSSGGEGDYGGEDCGERDRGKRDYGGLDCGERDCGGLDCGERDSGERDYGGRDRSRRGRSEWEYGGRDRSRRDRSEWGRGERDQGQRKEAALRILIKTDPCNQGSMALASKLGFRFIGKGYTAAGRCCCLYEWYC